MHIDRYHMLLEDSFQRGGIVGMKRVPHHPCPFPLQFVTAALMFFAQDRQYILLRTFQEGFQVRLADFFAAQIAH
jgi:hypothetical protein